MSLNSEAEKSGIEPLMKQVGDIDAAIKANRAAQDQSYRDLHNELDGVKKENAEIAAKAEELVRKYSEVVQEGQRLQEEQKSIQKTLQSPLYQSQSDLDKHDREAAFKLQRLIHIERGGEPDKFREDPENLIDIRAYRSAAFKLAKAGPIAKEEIIKSFSEAEKRAFEAGSLSTGFFSPETLGFTIDCNVECASLLDLYGRANVNKSTYRALQIEDYGSIGSYQCPATCDAELGPEGNIKYVYGNISDFRGVFCLQKEVIAEADYDLLSFIVNAAGRSYRINRNRALIVGDGENEPKGWLSGDYFPSRATSEQGKLLHTDVRQFLSLVPSEYGRVAAVMHPNTFAFIVSQIATNGRFFFGDGELAYTPDMVKENIRVSKCLPDPTKNLTVANGSFDAGAFVMAAAAWATAYYAIDKRPLTFQQWVGGSSMWCSKYQFWAQDGGFVGCPAAGLILKIQ